MSLVAVQQRVDEIRAQLSLPPLRGASALGASSFASVLQGMGGVDAASSFVDAGSAKSGDAVVDTARKYLGVPYEWGGTDPEGFDCSGLVQHVFREHGIELPRVSSDQARAGRPVELNDLRAGDLVFFGRPVDHVGIYAGDGKMVVAPHRGARVRVQDVNMSAVTAARRVLPDPAPSLVGGGGASNLAVGLPAAGKPFAGMIESAARSAGIDPKLLAAVAWSESNFRADARSPAGALGMMQIMPGTAAGLGVNPLDPREALEGGARYLKAQLQKFGRVDLALAAYNAGPAAVTKAGGVPDYAETKGYIARVMERMGQL